MRLSMWLSTVALSAGVLGLSGAAFGQITGNVKLDGKAPEMKPVDMSMNPDCAKMHTQPIMEESVVVDGSSNLKNVVVYLTGASIKATPPAQPAVLDQKGCQYTPHVVVVVVGQELIARNEDSLLHNVHTLPDDNQGTNIAQINKQDDKLPTLKTPEFFQAKCDVHPWMKAWIAGVPNQYAAITGADGNYSIDTKGLADGEYELHAWQEKCKEPPVQKVTVQGGKATVDLKLVTKKKVAAADSDKTVETVSVKMVECAACADGKCAKPADSKVAAAK